MAFRLGILTTHPIQYQVPWFRKLAEDPELDVHVMFCGIPDASQQGAGFGIEFQWDIPLLSGYQYEVLDNVAPPERFHSYRGCDTPGIRQRIRDGRFHAFLVYGWHRRSCFQAFAACRQLGLPLLGRGESNGLRPISLWKRLIHAWFLRRFNAFLVTGWANHHFYRQRWVPARRLFRSVYCVDNERFVAQVDLVQAERSQWKERWQIPDDRTVFLFCGKFEEKKRPLDFLGAVATAADRGAPIHALLVGTGHLDGPARELVQSRRIPATFAGFLNQGQIAAAYVAADCLVLPSDYGETWGLVVNEAMACGIPALVSDRAGCGPDLIVPDQTGRVFPFGDVDRLAVELAQLARNPETLARWGQAAREHIASYSLAAAVEGVRSALRFVCPRKDVVR